MARNWNLVKPQVWIELPTIELANAEMIDGVMSGGEPIVAGGVKSTMTITNEILTDHNFEKLEHVTVKVWVSHTRRGDVEIELISPAGIRSVLATARKNDDHTTGFVGWTFMTLKHWYVS
jgi:kexin